MMPKNDSDCWGIWSDPSKKTAPASHPCVALLHFSIQWFWTMKLLASAQENGFQTNESHLDRPPRALLSLFALQFPTRAYHAQSVCRATRACSSALDRLDWSVATFPSPALDQGFWRQIEPGGQNVDAAWFSSDWRWWGPAQVIKKNFATGYWYPDPLSTVPYSAFHINLNSDKGFKRVALETNPRPWCTVKLHFLPSPKFQRSCVKKEKERVDKMVCVTEMSITFIDPSTKSADISEYRICASVTLQDAPSEVFYLWLDNHIFRRPYGQSPTQASMAHDKSSCHQKACPKWAAIPKQKISQKIDGPYGVQWSHQSHGRPCPPPFCRAQNGITSAANVANDHEWSRKYQPENEKNTNFSRIAIWGWHRDRITYVFVHPNFPKLSPFALLPTSSSCATSNPYP